MVLMTRGRPSEFLVNPDTGRKYRYEMIYDDDRAAYAETFGDLASALIAGYREDAIRARLSADRVPEHGLDQKVEVEIIAQRILYAVRVQVRLQAMINAEHWDQIQEMDEETRAVVNGSRVTQPSIVDWHHEVHLVLSAHEYAPYGDKEKPEGRIMWINPYTDRSLLMSLHEIGHLQVFYNWTGESGLHDQARACHQLRPWYLQMVAPRGHGSGQRSAVSGRLGRCTCLGIGARFASHVRDGFHVRKRFGARATNPGVAPSVEQSIGTPANAHIPSATPGFYPARQSRPPPA